MNHGKLFLIDLGYESTVNQFPASDDSPRLAEVKKSNSDVRNSLCILPEQTHHFLAQGGGAFKPLELPQPFKKSLPFSISAFIPCPCKSTPVQTTKLRRSSRRPHGWLEKFQSFRRSNEKNWDLDNIGQRHEEIKHLCHAA